MNVLIGLVEIKLFMPLFIRNISRWRAELSYRMKIAVRKNNDTFIMWHRSIYSMVRHTNKYRRGHRASYKILECKLSSGLKRSENSVYNDKDLPSHGNVGVSSNDCLSTRELQKW